MSEDSFSPPKTNIYRKDRFKPSSGKTCGIAEICQTCSYINEPYAPTLKKKWQTAIEQLASLDLIDRAHVSPPKNSEKPIGYRNHAKLAVRPAKQAINVQPNRRFAVGLFQPKSHKVVDVSSCPLHRHTINQLVTALTAKLEASIIEPYDEVHLTGDLRYIAIRSSHLTDELMLTFVMTADHHRQLLRTIVAQLREEGHQIQAAFLNINGKNTNVIFGDESKHLLGASRLRENLCEFNFEIGPTSFFQVNPSEAENIYRRLEQLCGYNNKQDVAWDLYCGVGQISLVLSRCGYRVLGVEMNPQSIRDAQRNSTGQKLDLIPTFLAGKVENEIHRFPSWSQKPRLIVTNPARKGLDEEVRKQLKLVMSREQDCEFIYISCEIDSLARDLHDICSDGLKLRQLECFDMFPYTEKLEWLAVIR